MSESTSILGTANLAGDLKLGNGASFWAYISPQNDTAKNVNHWSVVIRKVDQNGKVIWEGFINSDNPRRQLQTPGLSGIFTVTVDGSGPTTPEQQFKPQPGTQPNIGCNSNCAAMVGIVSNAAGTSANYWTVWDAICKP